MSRVTALSGLGAKGPACFLLEADGKRLLLDLGYGPQPGLLPDVSAVGRVDALLLSHSHADHAGGLELLPQVGNPPIYASDIVRRLLPREVQSKSLPLKGTAEVLGLRITTGRNGHAPGGVWIHIDLGGGFLYMGDNSSESGLYAYDDPPQANAVICDASYGDYDTPLRKCAEEFAPLFDDGPLLLPIPVAGRGPEIALHLARSGRALPFIDDALRASLTTLSIENSDCLKPQTADRIAQIAREAPAIGEPTGVMLAAVADASSGAAARLVSAWEDAATPFIVFTGYVPPGTPAERLTKSGRASYRRWNVHPLLANNARLVRDVGAKTVMPAFGDRKHLPVWQKAFAPARVVVDGPVEF